MRPVPVVFLRIAFSPQLTTACQSLSLSHGDGVGERTLAGLGRRVAARGAGVLLDVEGATTWAYCQSCST
jgi:hypothetical protein